MAAGHAWAQAAGEAAFAAASCGIGADYVRACELAASDGSDTYRVLATCLRGVRDGISDGLVMIDASQQIVAFNRAAEEEFGYRANDIRGKALDVLIPERVRADHRQHVGVFRRERARRRRMSDRDELLAVQRDSSEFHVGVTISRLDYGGEPHAMAIIEDVTDWHESLAALRHRASHDELANLPIGQV